MPSRRVQTPTQPGDVVTVALDGAFVDVHFFVPGEALARHREQHQLWAALAAGLLIDDLDARALSHAASTLALAELEAAYGPYAEAPVPL